MAAVAALALLPHPSASAREGQDPLRTLGADSPLCKQALDATARSDCRATGAIEHPYPLDHYRFDWHITTGVTHITENFLAITQWVCSIAWMASLYLLKGVLLMFQWAFSVDLLGRSMSGARATLVRLHETTLGQPWFLAAISVLALWGIWRGLVQRQTIATVAGLGAAVAMMVAALIVIDRPAETIGALSRGANDVSLSFLSGASNGTIAHPQLAISESSRQLFDSIVLRPWCALDFADVRWCLARAPGDHLTRAERWLRYAPDTPQRNAEYNAVHTAGSYRPDDPKLERQLAGYRLTKADEPKVDMQGKSKTVTRAVLLALILIGQLGAIALVGWLAFRVLFQGVLTLILLLLAPVMLLAPAFGEAGRNAFRKWGLRLLAAVCSKAIYALLLAIVLAIASMLAELDNAFPWAVLWLLEGVFWWGVIVKRNEILAFASSGERHDAIGGLYYKGRVAKAGVSAVGGAVVGTVAAAARPARRASTGFRERARGDTQPESRSAAAYVDRRRRAESRARVKNRDEELPQRLARHRAAQRELRPLNKQLRRYDRRTRAAPTGSVVEATPLERALAARRAALRDQLMAPAELAAARRRARPTAKQDRGGRQTSRADDDATPRKTRVQDRPATRQAGQAYPVREGRGAISGRSGTGKVDRDRARLRNKDSNRKPRDQEPLIARPQEAREQRAEELNRREQARRHTDNDRTPGP